jgi:hypothetical protein
MWPSVVSFEAHGVNARARPRLRELSERERGHARPRAIEDLVQRAKRPDLRAKPTFGQPLASGEGGIFTPRKDGSFGPYAMSERGFTMRFDLR